MKKQRVNDNKKATRYNIAGVASFMTLLIILILTINNSTAVEGPLIIILPLLNLGIAMFATAKNSDNKKATKCNIACIVLSIVLLIISSPIVINDNAAGTGPLVPFCTIILPLFILGVAMFASSLGYTKGIKNKTSAQKINYITSNVGLNIDAFIALYFIVGTIIALSTNLNGTMIPFFISIFIILLFYCIRLSIKKFQKKTS